MRVSTENAPKARSILESKIAKGRESALALFERINEQAPTDAMARGGALHFHPTPAGIYMALGQESDGMGIHKHALGQLASRAGVPSAYLSELAGEEGWKRDLASSILHAHYHDGTPKSRYLVRSVHGEVRGFLSDKFRRLDSRPLVEAFATECQKVGAVPVDGTFSDTRVALKAIIPTVYEPVPGEVMAFGVEWANSDFGNGTHSLRAFALRLWCLNGATMEDALSQVHLGRQLSDDLDLSQRTYDLDTKTSISALRDVVAGTLAPKKIEALCAGIQAANEKEINWKHASTRFAKKLLKGELEAARMAFESEDVVNLPAGKSLWRVSNALSWIAGHTEDSDRKLELERMAGAVLHGKAEAIAA